MIKFDLQLMFRKLILSGCQLFIFILVCVTFFRGQELNSILHNPFQKCWESPEKTSTTVASDNESNIFIPLFTGIIKAIDLNKNEAWRTDIGGEILSPPIYHARTLYILSKLNERSAGRNNEAANAKYSITSLDADSGIAKWKKTYRSKKIPTMTLQKDRLLIVLTENAKGSGEKHSNFNVLDALTGNLIFEKNHSFEIKQIFNTANENGENIIILSSLNSIISFSILDGKIITSATSIKNIQTGAVFNKGVLLSNDRGGIYFVNPKGEENEFKIRLGAGTTSIAQHKNSILISSLDNFIYSLSTDGKQIKWKKRFAGRIIEKPILLPDTVIAFSQGDNSLYFLNSNNGKTFNRIDLSSEEEIIGSLLLLNKLIVVSTNKGIKVFSSSGCGDFTATER